MAGVDDIPELLVADALIWRAWLEDNFDASDGVWLRLAKKGVTEPTSLRYDEALDEALCFGWIDGLVRSYDASTFCQRFTPRRARSSWSARNVAHVARLTVEGRMHPAGVAEVQRAKTDGRWERAYGGTSRDVPADLGEAIAANPRAAAMFAILTSRNRFAVIHRVEEAKRADTRARRIDKFVDMLANGETLYPQKRTLNG
jgi:uncharacterized protein YdeI (YjbR/CyaY-like superfamily)